MKKENVIFLLIIISGLIIGSYLGSIAVVIPWLNWLNYGKTIGLTQPFVLDLGFIYLQFALHISFTIAGIMGMVIASVIFKLTRR